METTYVARIAQRAQTLTYKHPLIPQVFRKPLDSRDPTKGWVRVSEEAASILRTKRIGGGSDPHLPPLFDVMTQEEAVHFQQLEMERLGLGTAENPVGGAPLAQARVRQLEGKLVALEAQNAKILVLLAEIAAQKNPELAAALKASSPETLALDLAPATTPPLTTAEKRVADEAAAKEEAAKAKAAAPPPPKTRPGTNQATAPATPSTTKPARAPNAASSPASLTAKMRDAGMIGGVPTDLSDGDTDAAVA
jgi:hypothetical protein